MLAAQEHDRIDWSAAMRSAGLRPTPQRLAVAEALSRTHRHPTAQELFVELAGALPRISFATVYNTLGALRAAGLCRELSVGAGAARFDANLAPHDHAVCDHCGRVVDILSDQATPDHNATGEEGTNLPDFVVRSVERLVRGACSSCVRARSVPG